MPDLRFCPKCGQKTASESGGGFIARVKGEIIHGK